MLAYLSILFAHVAQSAMDSAFGKFGNIILLKKVNGSYLKEELPDMR